jgi:hypothetical protein
MKNQAQHQRYGARFVIRLGCSSQEVHVTLQP